METGKARLTTFSIAALLLSAITAALATWIPAFSPCRVFYRTHNAVQDGVLCHTHLVFVFSSSGLFVLGILTGLIGLVRRILPWSKG
jgi:hypothetical protein